MVRPLGLRGGGEACAPGAAQARAWWRGGVRLGQAARKGKGGAAGRGEGGRPGGVRGERRSEAEEGERKEGGREKKKKEKEKEKRGKKKWEKGKRNKEKENGREWEKIKEGGGAVRASGDCGRGRWGTRTEGRGKKEGRDSRRLVTTRRVGWEGDETWIEIGCRVRSPGIGRSEQEGFREVKVRV